MKPDINICYLITRDFLDLTIDSIKSIESLFTSSTHRLRFHIIGTSNFNVPDNISFKISPQPDIPISHQRALIPEIINTDRVLFLDSDTIINTNISKLWDICLEGNTIGAVQHQLLPHFSTMIDRYGLSSIPQFSNNINTPYFNSGVMLIDCNKWRSSKKTSHLKDAFSLYRHSTSWKMNEPGFNLVFLDDWYQLQWKWNYRPSSEYFKRPYILHYYAMYHSRKPQHTALKDSGKILSR